MRIRVTEKWSLYVDREYRWDTGDIFVKVVEIRRGGEGLKEEREVDVLPAAGPITALASIITHQMAQRERGVSAEDPPK